MHLSDGQVCEPKSEGEQRAKVPHDIVDAVSGGFDRLGDLALVEGVAEVGIFRESHLSLLVFQGGRVAPGVRLDGFVKRELLLVDPNHAVGIDD